MTGTLAGQYRTASHVTPTRGVVRYALVEWQRGAGWVTVAKEETAALDGAAFSVAVEPGFYRVTEYVMGSIAEQVVEVVEGQTTDMATAAAANPSYSVPVKSVGGALPGPDGDIPIASIPGTPGPAGADGADGAPGPAGADGAAASIIVGTTTTGAPGSDAAVSNVGTSAAAVLDFIIPRGAQGPAGADGDDGAPGAPGTPGTDGSDGADGATGPAGPPGASSAERFGLLALTFPPAAAADVDPDALAMVSGRLYAWWLPLPAGTTVTGVAVPVASAAAGPGSVTFGVYQEDLSQLGTTGDVLAALTGTGSWIDLPLTAAAASTGAGVWVVGLSTASTGAALVTAPTAAEGAWVFNRGTAGQARRLESVATLPATLAPAGMLAYIDFLIGIY